ncbi:MAG: N-acetyl-gamma-glutamyl-phosphate reductase, partial [Oscillospiraceae bacterium]
PFTAHSQTGLSGGGNSMIADYAQNCADEEHSSPRQYALAQAHKHLPEMKKMCGLDFNPVFNPIVANFYCGMVVTVPLFTRLLAKDTTCKSIYKIYKQYYKDQPLIKVHEANVTPENGFLPTNALAGSDGLEIFIFGNAEQIVVASRFDNLGKGSSGAAIQCMNILLDNNETKGLVGF